MRQETRDKDKTKDERQEGLAYQVSAASQVPYAVIDFPFEGLASQVSCPSPFLFTLKAWPVITLLTIGLCLCTELIASWFGVRLGEQQTVLMMRQMGSYTWKQISTGDFSVVLSDQVVRTFSLNILLAVLVMPVVEELIFRGILFKLPCRFPRPPAGDGPSAARRASFAIVSSALFSAAHYIQAPQSNNAFLALFFFGLAQCWLYRKTDSIWCPMLNHGLFNLTNLILLFVLPV